MKLMIFLPKIKIKPSKKADIEQFIHFLNHSFHVQSRNMILNAFPDLDRDLVNNQQLAAVNKFVSCFYKQNAKKMKQIIQEDEKTINAKGIKMLSFLKKLMDASWSGKETFYAIPTILPFSPYRGNSFYYSILGKIRNNKNQKDVLSIAAHEISHFIFYDTMEEIKRNYPDIKLSKESEHYLKEALAPAVLNEKGINELLKLNDYRGNQELHHLQVKLDKKILGFVEFISCYYHSEKIEKKRPFDEVLFGLVKILSNADNQLILRRNIWNKYGLNIEKSVKNFNKYKKPIILDL